MVRHVRTAEGSSFFGLPIGSPLGGGLIRSISAAAAQVGHHLDFSKTDHLSDNPISAADIEKAKAKGLPTVDMGAHVPISTDPGMDHESMLNRLHPGTHIYHVSHSGRPHEHVKAAEGHWNEVAPGTGKDMGYKASAKDLGKSLSTADSAHVTQVGKTPSAMPSVSKQIAGDSAEQKALKAWQARQDANKASGKSLTKPGVDSGPSKDDSPAERKAYDARHAPARSTAGASKDDSPAEAQQFAARKAGIAAGASKDDSPAEAQKFASQKANASKPSTPHAPGTVLSQNDIANLPAGHLIQHSSGNRFISTGDGRMTGVDQSGSFGKGDYGHDAGKGRLSYKGPIDPKNLPKSKINYHYAPKKAAATGADWHAAAKKAFSAA